MHFPAQQAPRWICCSPRTDRAQRSRSSAKTAIFSELAAIATLGLAMAGERRHR